MYGSKNWDAIAVLVPGERKKNSVIIYDIIDVTPGRRVIWTDSNNAS
jgi:hypothetical protein